MDDPLDNSADQRAPNRWLAYELHDGLLQWLISARMETEAMLAQLESNQSELGDKLKATLASLENALEEGRELIGFLEQQPPNANVSIDSRLATFIEQVQVRASAAGQAVTFQPAEPSWFRMPHRTAWNLLRIAQQAVRNSIRHAGPCTISVICGWQNPQTLLLTVSDNGRGFDQEQASAMPRHYGLTSMRHRAKLLGAKFHLQSAVGKGTTITVELSRSNGTRPA